MTGFVGFGPEVGTFFTGLERDNSRDYMAAHRRLFEDGVRGAMQALLEELRDEFGGEVKLFRQHRDLRFTPDRSPYETHTYGILQGSWLTPSGLYASISAHGLLVGSGYHVMARDQLDRYRAAVAGEPHGPDFALRVAGAEAAGLELWGLSLRTAPRGYPREHPRIALLRRTSLTLGARRPIGDGITRDAALAFTAATWRAAAPVTEWLAAQVGPTQVSHRGRGPAGRAAPRGAGARPEARPR